MTIASKLNTVNTALSNIKQALEDKGCTITGDITTYSAVIDNIPSSGGDIITAKNATGSVISEGDKVFIEKVTGGWNIKNDMYYAINGNNIGNDLVRPDNYKVVNQNSYVILPEVVRLDLADTWEFVTKLYLVNSSNNGMVISSSTNTYGTLYLFIAGYTPKFNTTYEEFASSQAISQNTLTWIKIRFTGTAYEMYLSTDGTNYALTGSVQSTAKVAPTTSAFIIGKSVSTGSFYISDGRVYFGDTYLNVNGVRVWNGINEYITTNSFTGIAQENIAVDDAGEVKTSLPEPITISVTSNADNAEISAE